MANIFIKWEPSLTGTLQIIQYKEDISNTWITVATVDILTTNYIISGIDKEKIYHVRIGSNCSSGGIVYSPIIVAGNESPICEDRTIVFQICNSNAIEDDDFEIYINDILIGTVDLGNPIQGGSVFIGSLDNTLVITEPDFICSLSNMDIFFFDPSILKRENIIRMKNIQNNGMGNYGLLNIRNYENIDSNLENPCIVEDFTYNGASGSDFQFNFEYTNCCKPYEVDYCFVGIYTESDVVLRDLNNNIVISGNEKVFRVLGAASGFAIRTIKNLEVSISTTIDISTPGLVFKQVGILTDLRFRPTTIKYFTPSGSMISNPGLRVDPDGKIYLYVDNDQYTGPSNITYNPKIVEWNTTEMIECRSCKVLYNTIGEGTDLCNSYTNNIEFGVLIKTLYQNATYEKNVDTIVFNGTSNTFTYTFKVNPGLVSSYSRESILKESLNFPIISVDCNIRVLNPNVGGKELVARLYKNGTLISTSLHTSTARSGGDPSLVVPFSFNLSSNPLNITNGDIIHIEHDLVEETPQIVNLDFHSISFNQQPPSSNYRMKVESEIIDIENSGYGNKTTSIEFGPGALSPTVLLGETYPTGGLPSDKAAILSRIGTSSNNEDGTSGGISTLGAIDFKKIFDDNPSVNKIYYRGYMEKVIGPGTRVGKIYLFKNVTYRQDKINTGGTLVHSFTTFNYTNSYTISGWVKKRISGGYDLYYNIETS